MFYPSVFSLLVLCVSHSGVYGTYHYPGTSGSSPGQGPYSRVEVHRKTATWLQALETCRQENSTLLCYTEARHISQVAAELTFFAFPKMWIRNRNCSVSISEPNLSVDLKNLNFSRTQVKYVSQHKFQKESETQQLPFICFANVSSPTPPSSLLYAPEQNDKNQNPGTAAPEDFKQDTTETGETTTRDSTPSTEEPFCPPLYNHASKDFCQYTRGGENCTVTCEDNEEKIIYCVGDEGKLMWNDWDPCKGLTTASTRDSTPSTEEPFCPPLYNLGLKNDCQDRKGGEKCTVICDGYEEKIIYCVGEGGKLMWNDWDPCKDEEYFLIKEYLSWEDSRKRCLSNNGKLACIDKTLKGDRFIMKIKDVIQEIAENDTATFWYNGRVCDQTGGDQPGHYMKANIKGLLYETSSSLYENYSGLCKKTATISSSSSSAPSTLTTSKTTTPKTTPSTTTVRTSSFHPQCCPEIDIRGIKWETHCGKSAWVYKQCPDGTEGTAMWFCDTSIGEWTPSSPILENCVSSYIHHLNSTVNRTNVPDALDTLSKEPPRVGGDIVGIGKILSEVVENFGAYVENIKDPTTKKEVVLNITDKVASLGDTMLTEKTIWKDLTTTKRAKTVTDLLENGKKTAFQYAYSLDTNETRSLKKSSFTLQVIKNNRGEFGEDLVLPRPSDDVSSQTSQFVLPQGFDKQLSTNESFTFVVFYIYNNLEDLLISNSDQNTGNFTDKTIVNSDVLSVSISEDGASVPLEQEATFVLRHSETNAEHPVCSFWNLESLNWDRTGCRLVRSNDSFTECACNHLTNFAVLMDIHEVLDELHPDDLENLKTITQIGCIISIIFLSATISITIVYRSLWGMRNSVHRNLCICLLIAEVLFLAGGSRTEVKVFCSIIAGLLHYFFTAAFCWMFLESVVIYLLLYKVFSPKKPYTKRFYGVGYGVPLVIVSVSAAIRPDGYGTDTACWLSAEHEFRWSFVGPVAAILVINFVALFYALWVAIRTNKKVSAKQGTSVSRTWILGALTLVPLLGSTWAVGFVLLSKGTVVLYVFTVLNSLQGFAIFIVQCVMNQSCRKCLLKTFAKYTHLVPVGSLTSTTQSDTRRVNSSNRQRRSTSNNVLPPETSPYPLPSTRHFGPLVLRSISTQSKSFDLSSGEYNDGSEVCFSASDDPDPHVVLKHKQVTETF